MRTAESVLLGHPDKLCDLIADRLLDEYLKNDPKSRVAIEVQGGHGVINILGEVTSGYEMTWKQARDFTFEVLKDIGYDYPHQTQFNIVRQSPEIAAGVKKGGAGDSGITIGYACNENEAMIPQELYLARKLTRAIEKDGRFGPDGKVMITLE